MQVAFGCARVRGSPLTLLTRLYGLDGAVAELMLYQGCSYCQAKLIGATQSEPGGCYTKVDASLMPC